MSRAVVETGMLIRKQSLSLDVVALHGGFNREDRRSGLGFPDGIANIAPELRRAAIETKVAGSTAGDPAWMDGGTYMVTPTSAASRPPTLLTLIGGGYYAVPPTGGPFPGADMF